MPLERLSPCKVNLLLNLLGRRADGFHALETVMQPIPLHDHLTFDRAANPGVTLTCTHPELPVDGSNLVHRAATAFLTAAGIRDGVRIHLDKRLPLAGGIGAGSANAAVTFLALNELFGHPLPPERLHELAATLGSDVPFFLSDGPALATGRGEVVEPLKPFAALRGRAFFLAHPGFGISTPWAYQNMARFPAARDGQPGRAARLVAALNGAEIGPAVKEFYNSLEAPAFDKFPVLALYQEFLREQGALAALMSGSGSTTFALAENLAAAETLAEKFRGRFGANGWTATVAV